MFVMLVAYAILSIAANTFGLEERLDCSSDPSIPGCDFIFMPVALPDLGSDGGGDTGSIGGGDTGTNGGGGN